MKRREFIALGALPWMAGCASWTKEEKIAAAARMARTAAYIGTLEFLQRNPSAENVVAFKLVGDALAVLLDHKQADVQSLAETLAQLPIGSLEQQGQYRIYWAEGVVLWDMITAPLDVKSNEAVYAIGYAMLNGMRDALALFESTGTVKKAMGPVLPAAPAKPKQAPETIRRINI